MVVKMSIDVNIVMAGKNNNTIQETIKSTLVNSLGSVKSFIAHTSTLKKIGDFLLMEILSCCQRIVEVLMAKIILIWACANKPS